jgi:multiple sugar transport system permease protein
MFRLIDAFKRFDSIYIMTAGGPGNSTETLNLYAYNNAFSYLDTGYASALAMFLFMIIATLSVFTIRKVRMGGGES